MSKHSTQVLRAFVEVLRAFVAKSSSTCACRSSRPDHSGQTVCVRGICQHTRDYLSEKFHYCCAGGLCTSCTTNLPRPRCYCRGAGPTGIRGSATSARHCREAAQTETQDAPTLAPTRAVTKHSREEKERRNREDIAEKLPGYRR